MVRKTSLTPKGVSQMAKKKYVMVNKENGARIVCTEKYVIAWLARGFEIVEIIMENGKEDYRNQGW
jgi:hypothetical protein